MYVTTTQLMKWETNGWVTALLISSLKSTISQRRGVNKGK